MEFPLDKDSYEFLSLIGKGATSDVYLARCKSSGLELAIKIINLEICPIEIDVLRREVSFWSTAKHPNIVKYYGSFIAGSSLFILMEYMSAGSCYEIMRSLPQKRIVDESAIATILKEALETIAYLHSNRQIHRDIKTGNLLMDSDGHVKVGDFGVAANLIEAGQRKRARFTVIGTPCYLAPEVLKESTGYTEEVDIWSLGITAIEMATGSAPYSNLFPLEIIVKIVNNPPPSLPEDQKFSSAFRDFVKQCLKYEPGERPTAADLLKHKFIKTAKDPSHLCKAFLDGLTSLPQRYSEAHTKPDEDNQAEQRKVEFKFDIPQDSKPAQEAIGKFQITRTDQSMDQLGNRVKELAQKQEALQNSLDLLKKELLAILQ